MDKVFGADNHCGKTVSQGADDVIVISPVAYDLYIHPYAVCRLAAPVREPRNIFPRAGLVVVQDIRDGDLAAIQRHDLLLPQDFAAQVIRDVDICAVPIHTRAEQDMQRRTFDYSRGVVRRPEIIGYPLPGMPYLTDLAVFYVAGLPAAELQVDVKVLRMLLGSLISGIVQAVPPTFIFAYIPEIVGHKFYGRV